MNAPERFTDEPASPFLTPEHLAFRNMLRRFVTTEIEPFAAQWDEAGEFPRELYLKAASIGLLQLGFPEEYGGVPADQFMKIVASQGMEKKGFNGNALIAALPGASATMNSTQPVGPDRDSDMDAGIIAHEYGHGISNRLTGGPSNTSCLGNQEQMGEGWSDWQTLFLHAAPSDTATTQRPVGAYSVFEPANTPGFIGIRRFPYSTDTSKNPLTFADIAQLIATARQRAVQAVNTTLIELYWQIGEHISRKIAASEWGDGVVDQLACYLAQTQPGLRGFTRRNLFRMRQFYEAYAGNELVSPLVTQLLPDAASVFRDSYVVEFLDLPRKHSEADLHQGLLNRLKEFLTEVGRDFCFVGSNYPVQVGNQDFEIDLLLFHREIGRAHV